MTKLKDKSTYPHSFYDSVEASMGRLNLTFKNYFDNFDLFLELYEEITDGDELQFVNDELDVFRDISQYLIILGEGLNSDDSFQSFRFEKRYKPYMNYVRVAIAEGNKVDNSLDRKCRFLEQRKKELETIPVQHTLEQRLLLIRYLERTKRVSLTKFHPDNTGQAQILTFLLNVSYQNVRSGLGKSFDSFKTKKNLIVILELLKPFQLYLKDIIDEVEADLLKVEKKP
ncbi:hypothetical protein A0256_20915 [Mucilaginibacter sp. PAMC 26640]|nr:hypothetical protein A0256_20915 [Mucilaginibacter sp. PAMC 26640]